MKKVVIAMDSFKGCLSSAEVEAAAEEGVRSVYPDCSTFCIPIADGGEGWLNSLLPKLGGSIHRLSVHGPLMELVFARYGITKDGRTAILEMAETSGLMLVPIPKRNPMLTTSLGAGELILHLMNQGIRHFIIGIGG
ncbi:MAG: glycerate kinase, partial [Bacteroidaceae bacterium]|nr:glycerate kinase [Bacteroidaceae bacterium]